MNLIRFIDKFPILLFFLSTYLGTAQLSYTPDDVLRTTIRKEFWKNVKLETPKKQRFFTSLTFGSNECFSLYEKAAKQRKWEPYEVATITAFYKIILKETISGKDKSEEEIKNIYENVKSEYESSNLPYNLDQRELQNIFDQLVLKAIWVGTVYELSKKNSAEIQNKAQNLLQDFDIKSLIAQSAAYEREVKVSKKPEVSSTTITKKQTQNTSLAVEDIILRTVTSYGLGGVYITNEVSVLYKNGDIYTDPSIPLGQLNVTRSKREEPKKWARWRKSGSVLKVTKPWKNKTYDWEKWFKLRPGNEVSKLKGRFKSIDAFGGSKVINANNVSFDGQGRFAWKSIKGGDTPWKPVYSKNNTAGTYVIDDYTLTLTYNNGVSESFFFGLYPKDNKHFVIGSNHFTPVKD